MVPLLPFLTYRCKFIEPCCGENDLVNHLELEGHSCVAAFDEETDARIYRKPDDLEANYFITNPPWSRDLLHPIITNLREQLPTWILLDADWAHTKQAADYMKYCSKMVAVGRVKWIPNSPYTGKDNCCWYKFDKELQQTIFYGRSK